MKKRKLKYESNFPHQQRPYYVLNDNAWCCVRPSGTEPKIKFYFGIKGTSLEDANQKNEALKKATMEMFE